MSATTSIEVPAPVVGRAITAACWDPARGGALLGSEDGGLLALPVDGPPVHLGPGLDGPVVRVAVDPATGAVAAAEVSGAVRVLPAGGPPFALQLGSRPRGLAWSSSGSMLALASQAAGLLVVDVAGARVAALGPSRRFRAAAWVVGGDGQRLVAAGAGGCTWIAPERSEPVLGAERNLGVAVSVAVDPRSGAVAVGELSGSVRIVPGEDEVEVSGWPDPVELLAWTATGRVVVAGGDEVTAWSAGEDVADPARRVVDGWVGALASHPWSGAVAVGSGDGEVVVWHPGGLASDLVGRVDGAVRHLVWDPLGEHLLAAGAHGAWWVALEPAEGGR